MLAHLFGGILSQFNCIVNIFLKKYKIYKNY